MSTVFSSKLLFSDKLVFNDKLKFNDTLLIGQASGTGPIDNQAPLQPPGFSPGPIDDIVPPDITAPHCYRILSLDSDILKLGNTVLVAPHFAMVSDGLVSSGCVVLAHDSKVLQLNNKSLLKYSN